MRAMIYDTYGSADVLRLADLPTPTAGPGQLLVEIGATSVNPVDWKLREGKLRFVMRAKLPITPGGDVAGVVRGVGAGVTGFQVGDRVMARVVGLPFGGSADFIAEDAQAFARWPSTMSAEEAAALPLAGLTAYQGLVDKAGLKAGERALVVGASGGVGHYAVQIAKALGATVVGVCSTRNLDLVKSLGADGVIDYTTGADLTAGGPFDVIYDAVGGYSWARLTQGLAPGGRVVTPIPSNYAPGALWALVTGRYSLMMVTSKGADLQILSGWAAEGRLRTHLDSTYALEDLADAHRHSETGRAQGKIAIHVQDLS